MTKTVLITGCSSGIGKQLSMAMLDKGYRVISTARSLEKIADLRAKGAITLALDVTAQASIDDALNQISAQGHCIDILVNNAGYGAMGPVAEMPSDELEKQFATNVFGPVYMVRACVPHMRQRGGGLIVNIGSVSGILVTPFSGAYCATKAALHALSDAMRMELAPFNINVMTVMPGAIESEFGNSAESSLKRTLPKDSLYEWVRDGIQKRAQASQSNPTPTGQFVKALLKNIEAVKPTAEVAIGNGSTILPLLARVLPTKLRDAILKRSFGLHHTPTG
ncbi:MAG: SDR family oxidoreductase [Ketobacter sp.]|nr:SDR family oxidoreductase [Ketobacter sp.]